MFTTKYFKVNKSHESQKCTLNINDLSILTELTII